ncbi:hypothetical protein GWC95_16455 [Sediminibacterium roseum]|uniref:Outer membrane protein beta-barrel domain-containing protein n=1 Tax=Sediminibacterium roseum TaxID=1978412 RepID=A0ABX0A0Q2_9BACT|nr:hypothetical protein [Sediminibacterium roseum]NCI51522.1 hypothetical protein [Sediminibacterium roseum]
MFKSAAILCTVLINLCSNLNAQSYKYPGFILRKNGETVKGEIAFAGKDKTVKAITFTKAGQQEKLTANDIAAFGRDNIDYYVSAIVSYYTNGLEIDQAKEAYSEERATDTAFLLQLVKGKISLYELRTSMRTVYFTSKSNGPINELPARVKLSGTNVTEQDKQYRDILINYANEEGADETMKADLMNVQYEYYSLKDAVIKLNEKSGGSTVIKNTGIKPMRIEIGAGVSYMKFTGTSIKSDGGGLGDFLSGTDFNGSTDPRISVSMHFGPNNRYTQIKGIVGLGFSTALLKGTSPYIASSASKQMDFYKKLSMVDFTLGAMFLVSPAKRSTFFVNPLVAVNTIVNGSTVKNTGVTPNFPVLGNPYWSFGGGLGYLFDKHRIEVRGETTLSNYASPSAKLSSTRFSLFYHYMLSRF